MAKKKKVEENTQGIDIRLASQDHSLIDRAAKRIAEKVTTAGGQIIGPVPLHVKKIKLEDQTVRKHKRRLVITNPNPEILQMLTTIEVPTGVSISLKINE